MGKNDEILHAFLSNPLLISNYDINSDDITTVQEAMHSDKPVIRAIAIMIMKASNDVGEQQVYNEIINYLNTTL